MMDNTNDMSTGSSPASSGDSGANQNNSGGPSQLQEQEMSFQEERSALEGRLAGIGEGIDLLKKEETQGASGEMAAENAAELKAALAEAEAEGKS